MRPIKFRAWDKNEKLWRSADDVGTYLLHMASGTNLAPHWELSQFTGLHDKNGKEIWEGDFCKLWIRISDSVPDPGPRPENIVIIEFQNYAWGLRHTSPELVHEDDREWRSFWDQEDQYVWFVEYLGVIGNRWENPELLESSENPS